MELLGVAIRFLHAAGAVSLVGAFASLVLVARPAIRSGGDVAQARRSELDDRLVRLARGVLVLTLGASVLDLWRQVGVVTGVGPRAGLDWDRTLAVLIDTRFGTIWLARTGLLVLLGTLLLLGDEDSERDRLALRLEGLALSGASLALAAASGHSAAAESGALAMAVDALHLLAAGVWAGGLVPLALCLAWASRLPDHAAAAAAAERFSRLGLAAVATLALTGAFATWQQVGSVPALVGTVYGRWLLAKLLLFALLIPIAARNLLVWRRRLERGGSHATPALSRLRWAVLGEVALAAAILGAVAVLGLTTPARHAEITWPLAFRFDWEATKTLPGVQPRVAIGSQVATLGLIALILAVLIRPRRWRIAALAGSVALALGAAVALQPLAVDANPATYLRPTVPYAAASIVAGQALYRTHCQSCHGVAGYGDGPAGSALPRRPADLTAKHAGDHTAGDLYWWVSHGIPPAGMPGFCGQLTPEERWDVINFVRALGAAERARDLGPVVSPRPVAVAPDFTFSTGVGEGRALKDSRGRGIVLLVFFTLPGSADRLEALSRILLALKLRGAEVLGVPLADAQGVYRMLGERRVFFPIAVEGAAEASAAYGVFRRDLTAEGQRPEPPPVSHMELLVDRQGYLRARWIPRILGPGADGWADTARLLAEIDRLAREAPTGPVAAEHVH